LPVPPWTQLAPLVRHSSAVHGLITGCIGLDR